MYRDMRGSMIKYPYVASPKMALTEAAIYMKECDIRHLPLVKDDKIVGLVSERDLLRYIDDSRYHLLTLADIVVHEPFVVSENEPLKNVLAMMAKNKMGSALVVNNENQLSGIFTTTDALLLLQSFLEGDRKFFDRNDGQVIYLREVAGWN